MSTTTYGIVTSDGKMLFKGYYELNDALKECERLNPKFNCRVVKVNTVIEYSEI